jgi:hypothetical protein
MEKHGLSGIFLDVFGFSTAMNHGKIWQSMEKSLVTR